MKHYWATQQHQQQTGRFNVGKMYEPSTDKQLEMAENVAYGPITLHWTMLMINLYTECHFQLVAKLSTAVDYVDKKDLLQF